MKLFTWKRMIGVTVLVLIVGVVGSWFGIGYFNLFHAHEHCIKQTGLALRIYAGDHDDRFPYHTNGFGDAIVQFLKDSEMPEHEARLFTAPGDDGSLLLECLRTGAHMPEDRCTRVYVQGLSETSNPMIAIVFDRYPTRGGDHFRRPWGPWMRDVCMLDGSAQFLPEVRWPSFRKEQIELLVAEGISRAEAEKLYAPFKR